MKKNKKVQNPEIEENKQENVEIASLKSQLARALADYDNLQKRVSRERDEGKFLAKLIIVSRLLPFFDMISDAQKHSGDAGLGIALKVLSDTLKDEGIEELKVSVGDTFNEEIHEAIETVEGDTENTQTVAEIALKGYKFIDGPVIRHTKVKVYK